MALQSKNIFAVPHNGRFILYAPLRGLVAEVSVAAVEQIRSFVKTGDPKSVDESVSKAIGGLNWIHEETRVESPPADRPFQPTTVTLFLTNRCNLRCSYCYARAGEFKPHDISLDLCKAAIDLVMKNARKQQTSLGVSFHGGGEPTLAWDVLRECVQYARDAASNHQPGVRFGLSTNGILSDEKIVFIAQTFPVVTVSFDGPTDIQDTLRPKADGSSSFGDLMYTTRRFRERNFPFVIRSTVTNVNVNRMVEMVEFFVQEVGCRFLHFEPAFSCGRCVGAANATPDPKVFAEEYIKALDRAIALHAGLRYSAVRLQGPMISFCGVAQDAFNITPYGQVTACYEVCHPEHPLADDFTYGRYDASSGTFHFDQAQIRKLRSLIVTNKAYCDGCFCRWGCAGDCPVKLEGRQLDFGSPSTRCHVNQTVTKALLARVLENPETLNAWMPLTSS